MKPLHNKIIQQLSIGRSSIKDLAFHLQEDETAVTAAVTILHKRGYVRQAAPGRWQLTPTGETALAIQERKL